MEADSVLALLESVDVLLLLLLVVVVVLLVFLESADSVEASLLLVAAKDRILPSSKNSFTAGLKRNILILQKDNMTRLR